MEMGTTMLVQVVLELFSVFNDVHGDERDVAGQRVGLLGTLDEDLIKVKSQDGNFSIRLFPHRHQMLIKGCAQFLQIKQEDL